MATSKTKGVMGMLPAPAGTCPLCARAHKPGEPHDASTLFYQFRFRATHGRDGSWADAMAHVAPTTAFLWRRELELIGVWNEPPQGVEPIAEPCDCVEPGAVLPMPAAQSVTVPVNP